MGLDRSIIAKSRLRQAVLNHIDDVNNNFLVPDLDNVLNSTYLKWDDIVTDNEQTTKANIEEVSRLIMCALLKNAIQAYHPSTIDNDANRRLKQIYNQI